MTETKDPAAVALGKKRWKGTSKEDRTDHAQMMNEKRVEKTTAAQRKASAKKAAAARWADKPSKKKAKLVKRTKKSADK